ARGRGEASDVRTQVPGDVGRVVEQPREVERARVVDLADAGDRLEHRTDVLDLQRLATRQNVCLRGLEHAVEPAQHDEREDHPPVLRLLVDAAELVRDRPDEGSVVAGVAVAHAATWPAATLRRPVRAVSSDPRLITDYIYQPRTQITSAGRIRLDGA